MRVTLPLEELDDELPEDFAPLEREPPELVEPDFEPPELGRLIPARPPLPELELEGFVAVDFSPLLDPERVAVVPRVDSELEPDRVEGLVTPDEPRLEVDDPERVVACPSELLLPEVKDPRERQESPERVVELVPLVCSDSDRSDPVELIRAPPMVVMTRCAGSVDPAFPRRQSSFVAVESFRAGARLTGFSSSFGAALTGRCSWPRVVPVSRVGVFLVSVGFAGSGRVTVRGRVVEPVSFPLELGAGAAGVVLVTGRGLASTPPSLPRFTVPGSGLFVRGLTTVPSGDGVCVVGVDRVPVVGVDRVPVAGVDGLVTVCPVPPRVTVPPVVPEPTDPRVTTPGWLEPVLAPGNVVPRVVVCVDCVSRGTPRVTRSRTDAEGLGSLRKNCVTSSGDPDPWLLPVPLPLPPRTILSATRDGSLNSFPVTRSPWFEMMPDPPSRESRPLTWSAVSDALSIRFEKRAPLSTTV